MGKTAKKEEIEIEKDEYWDRGSYNTYGGIEVECSDGTVAKQ